MNNNRLVDRYSTFHIEISQKWIMFQAKKNRNKRNRTCITMCASWVLGKSRHSCFSSIKKLLWFIGVENTVGIVVISHLSISTWGGRIFAFFISCENTWNGFMMIVFNNGSSHLEMGRERERECDRTKNAIFSHC